MNLFDLKNQPHYNPIAPRVRQGETRAKKAKLGASPKYVPTGRRASHHVS